jgi:hypothetical protein
MNFKDFINEEIALGNIPGQMDRLFGTKGFDKMAGAYVSSDVNGSQGQGQGANTSPLDLPGTDLQLPTMERQGRITTLLTKRNPIFIRLSDGTEANFTYDEFKRIQGEPKLGKIMMISFRRHPNSATKNHSQITKAMVMD